MILYASERLKLMDGMVVGNVRKATKSSIDLEEDYK